MSSQTEQLQNVMTFFKLESGAGQGAVQIRHKAAPAHAMQAGKQKAAPVRTAKPASEASDEQDFDKF
jgi:hypothetical protein